MRFLSFLLLLVSPLAASEERRVWRSQDGGSTLQGALVSRDDRNITLQRPDGNAITFALSRLHPEDVRWLDDHHPHRPPGPPAQAVFEDLVFGDTRQEVTEKLLRSPQVELAVPEHMLARLGLNGAFRTRATVGGLPVLLFFDWDDAGRMRELSLQTAPHPAGDVDAALVPCIDALREVLVMLHGPPKDSGKLPPLGTFDDGVFIGSHVWQIEQGKILLGLARERGNYLAMARISAK